MPLASESTVPGTGFEVTSGLSVWVTAIISVSLLAVLYGTHQGALLRMAVCGCAVAVGLVLYKRNPLSYIQFTLWMWFSTPLLRRVIDLKIGFADQNLVLLAPLLVTAISALSLGEVTRSGGSRVPFLFCTSAVLYGFAIGLVVNPSAELIYGLFNWMAPPVFGLFLYLHWRSYEDVRQVVQRTTLWAAAIMGAYGIYQYCAPPRWDVYWWQSLPYGMVAAFGRPFAYQVRVWSTLNAPAPFAGVMGMILLLNLTSRSKLSLPLSLLGYGAFALTLSRTEWIAWAVGTLYLAARAKPALLLKGGALVLLIAVLGGPLLSLGSSGDIVQQRIDSFSHLAADDSVNTRFLMYRHLSADLLLNPFGHGVSNTDVYQGYSLDSGPLRLLYNFGLLGTLFYLIGLLAALALLITAKTPGDMLPVACAGVLLASIAKLASVSAFMNVAGVMVWLCIGMGLSARRFHAMAKERELR